MRLVEFFYQELRGSCEMGGSITEGQELDFLISRLSILRRDGALIIQGNGKFSETLK